MAARIFFRRAAGMKKSGAIIRREAGQLQFLERARRHKWNLRPMLDDLWREFSRFADFFVGGIEFELQRKKFERKRVKAFVLKT